MLCTGPSGVKRPHSFAALDQWSKGGQSCCCGTSLLYFVAEMILSQTLESKQILPAGHVSCVGLALANNGRENGGRKHVEFWSFKLSFFN
jgi:hypothetical protein